MAADLTQDHREILALAETLLARVRDVPHSGAEEITRLRANLGSRAAQHLRDEDAMIIRPLFATGRIDELPGAMDVIAAIREARTRYSRHVGQWTIAAIQADRDGYAEALEDLIEDLKPLIRREEHDLYRPALRLLAESAEPSDCCCC